MAIGPLALQLYTVRDHLEKDPEATFRRLREIGYEHVETAGFMGRTAADFRACLDEAGLAPAAMHVGFDQLSASPAQVLENSLVLGVKYAVISYMKFDDAAAWIAAARVADDAGALLKKAGVQLCYHNHGHEFERFDGETALDLIMQNSDPDMLGLELDICWTCVGGVDPVALIQKYADRMPLIHVKDYRIDDGVFSFAEVGHGRIDWPLIFNATKAAHAAWYVVEQDESLRDSIESARISLEFLNRL